MSSDEDILPEKEDLDVKKTSDDPIDAESSSEDSSSRVNAAKAFFRAMYAGEDVDAEQYGMNVETMKPSSGVQGYSGSGDSAGQLEKAEARAAEMEGLYKRMAADFDNYRKRVEREKEELLNQGIQAAVKALLPALDDLDRALSSFNNNSDSSSIIESIKLISERFTKCLEQLGIMPLNVVGKPFDPRLHEPVQQITTADVPEGSVAHDLRRGYVMGERVIRPSLVNVATGHSADGHHKDHKKKAQSDIETGDHDRAHKKHRSDNSDK